MYMQAGNNYGNFSLQLGLRGELSQIRTKYDESKEDHDTTYFNLFPTVHMTYKLNEIHSLQISYSRRIQRPNHWWLNPFHSFTDSRNFFTGNPELKPEFTDSYEAGYLMNYRVINLYAGLFYRHSTGAMERLSSSRPSSPAPIRSRCDN